MSAMELMMETIRNESRRVDAAMRSDLEEMAPVVDPLLIKVLQYCLFNGGKRIRPLLAVLSARICGRCDPEIYRLERYTINSGNTITPTASIRITRDGQTVR